MNVFNRPTRPFVRPSRASADAGSGSSPPRRDDVVRTPVVAEHARGRAPRKRGGGPLASERKWAWLFLAPMLLGLAVLSAGPIIATLGISFTSWDLLTPPTFAGFDNFAACGRRPLLDRPPQHHLLHGRVGAPGHGHRTAAGAGPRPGDPGHRLDPNHVLPALRDLDGRRRPGLALDLLSPGWPAQRAPGPVGIPPQRWTTDPMWAMPSIILMSIWQGLGISVIIFLAGSPAIPQEYLDAAVRGRSRKLVPLPARHAAIAHPQPLLHGHPRPHRLAPGVRPGLRPGATGKAHGRHHHARLLHLRGGLPLLPDGLCERGGMGAVPHRGGAHHRLLPARSVDGCTTSDPAPGGRGACTRSSSWVAC